MRAGAAEREGRPFAPFLIVVIRSSVRAVRAGRAFRKAAVGKARGARPLSVARSPPRLFLDRSHFSAEKTRGARARRRRRWGCSWRRLRRRGRRRVLLVGAASSRGARVRPTPQESVATRKFSTKKLVVARPRLKVVPLFAFPFRPRK